MAEQEFPCEPNVDAPDENTERLLRAIEAQGNVTWQEIEDVLVDGGYSADRRKNLLKEVLTRLSQIEPERRSTEARQLTQQVKGVLEEYQSGKPAATDLL